tara:strand:+ start:1434 stop:1748 length:315 start_codon:yes stop_codon:yes gene_type:complete
MTFTIKQHDTSPAISYILSDQDGPVNLTGASVRFYCGSVVAEDADVTDASGGQVTYEWLPADTAQPGYYRAEFEVVYADGSKETFPNEGYIGVYIEADLGEPPA